MSTKAQELRRGVGIASQFDATGPSRPGRSARPGRAADPAGPARAPSPVRPARTARPLDLARALRVIAAAVGVLAAAIVLGWLETRPARPYHLPAPVGQRTLRQPLAIELVIDQSGSNSTSDPQGLRIRESAEVLRWLGRFVRPTDQVGVVQFSSHAVTTLPLMPVAPAARLARSATAPDPRVAGGGTDIATALALGVSNLADAPAQSRRMIILFTDGASDTRNSIAPVLARASGIDVFMIALDADGTFDQASTFWHSLPLRGITRMQSADRGSVARPIAKAILNETGQHLPR